MLWLVIIPFPHIQDVKSDEVLQKLNSTTKHLGKPSLLYKFFKQAWPEDAKEEDADSLKVAKHVLEWRAMYDFLQLYGKQKYSFDIILCLHILSIPTFLRIA